MLILFLLLLLQSTWHTASSAQPPSESGNSLSSSTTSTISVSWGFTIFLLVVAVGFFLSGIVFVLFRHILGVHFFGIGVVGGGGLGAGLGRRVPEGLSQETIEGFPTYFYEDVKVHRGVDADLECAICLSQFQDHEVLRLLPKCNHIFHPECIDPWLHSQATCPVCRSILEPSDNVLPTNSPPQMTTQTDPSVDNHQEITIMDTSPPVKSPIHPGSYHGGPSEPGSIMENRNGEPQIVLDRFTLRLPEEARCKLESTKWRFAKASSGRQHFRSKTPESGRIELNGLESEPDRISLSSLNRNWKAFVSQPASPLQTDSTL